MDWREYNLVSAKIRIQFQVWNRVKSTLGSKSSVQGLVMFDKSQHNLISLSREKQKHHEYDKRKNQHLKCVPERYLDKGASPLMCYKHSSS